MNREAALLGTPTWTTFAGELGAVDRMLIESGRMGVLERPDQLVVEKRVAESSRPMRRSRTRSPPRSWRDETCPGGFAEPSPSPGALPASASCRPAPARFDSRAHRIARSCVARGDTVTIYARRRAGHARRGTARRLPDRPRAARPADCPPGARGRRPGPQLERAANVSRLTVRRAPGSPPRRLLDRHRSPTGRSSTGWRSSPCDPCPGAEPVRGAVAEPHDIWHGMWAGSLPTLDRIRPRHGGRSVYDSRDVYPPVTRLRRHAPLATRLMTWSSSVAGRAGPTPWSGQRPLRPDHAA